VNTKCHDLQYSLLRDRQKERARALVELFTFPR
jgi:hypothetical protein